MYHVTNRAHRLLKFHISVLLLALVAALWMPTPSAFAQAGSAITSPGTGSSVQGSVPVRGTATTDQFARYELYFKQEPSGDESYIWFAGNTAQVFDGELGVWHTGDLVPGIYTLRLRVVRPDGNYGEVFARDLRVNMEAPTPTPTNTPEGPTPTPIPIDTPTPIIQPTPAAVSVEQPDLAEPTPTPALVALGGGDSPATSNSGQQPATSADTQADSSATVQSSGNAITRELGAAVSLERLSGRFFTGVRWAGGIFLIVAAIFGAKWLLQWLLARAG